MKALKYKNDCSENVFIEFFDDSATNDFLEKWVQNNLDKFNLSEEWNCKTEIHISGDFVSIVIDGDEDFKEIDIVTIQPVSSF